MTRKELSIYLPVFQAYVDGKTIQFRNEDNDEDWTDIPKDEELDIDNVMHGNCEYRVKPYNKKKKYRPFDNAEECLNAIAKHGYFLKSKNFGDHRYVIPHEIASHGAYISNFFCRYSLLFKFYDFLDDYPFGVEDIKKNNIK